MIGTSFVPEFKRCRLSSLGRSVGRCGKESRGRVSKEAQRKTAPEKNCNMSLPCDRSVPKSSISVEEYIPGAARKQHRKTFKVQEKKDSIKNKPTDRDLLAHLM